MLVAIFAPIAMVCFWLESFIHYEFIRNGISINHWYVRISHLVLAGSTALLLHSEWYQQLAWICVYGCARFIVFDPSLNQRRGLPWYYMGKNGGDDAFTDDMFRHSDPMVLLVGKVILIYIAIFVHIITMHL